MLNEALRELSRSVPLAAAEDMFIAIPAILMMFGIPIVAILTSHQRKMAEIMRQQPQADNRLQQQLDSIQLQLNDLRGMVQDHIIRTDQPVASVPPPHPSIENRLNG
jgi:hypothetical protein